MAQKLSFVIEAKNQASKALWDVRSQIDNVTNWTASITNWLKSANTSLLSFWKNFISNFWAIWLAVTAAVGVIWKLWNKVVWLASEFESWLADVATLIDTSVEDIWKIWTAVLEVSQRVPVDSQQLVWALFDVRSAWIWAAEAIDVLESSARLWVAWLWDTKQWVDLVTSALNTFGDSIESAEQAANVFFTVTKNGKTTISELSQWFWWVAALAQSAWLSLEELWAATAALTTTWLPASQAYSQLRAAISNILKPTKDAEDAANQLWIEFNIASLQSQGFAWFLDTLQASIEDLDPSEQTQRLSDLFWSVEAANAIISLTGATNEAFKATLDELTSWVNNLDVAFSKQTETLKSQSQILRNNVNSVLIELWTAILPIVTAAVKWLNDVVNFLKKAFNDIIQPVKNLFKDFWNLNWEVSLWTLIIEWLKFAIDALWVAIRVVTKTIWAIVNAIAFLVRQIKIAIDNTKLFLSILQSIPAVQKILENFSAAVWVYTDAISRFFANTREQIKLIVKLAKQSANNTVEVFNIIIRAYNNTVWELTGKIWEITLFKWSEEQARSSRKAIEWTKKAVEWLKLDLSWFEWGWWFEDLWSAAKAAWDDAKAAIDPIIKGFQDSNKEIEKSISKLDDLDSQFRDLQKEAVNALSDVNRQLAELSWQRIDIGIEFDTQAEQELSNRFVELQNQLWELEVDITTNTDWNTADLLLEQKRIQEEINQIRENVSQSVLDDAVAYSQLTETQKTLLSIEKERAEALKWVSAQESILQERKAILELQSQLENLSDVRLQTQIKDWVVTAQILNEKWELLQEINDQENIAIAQRLVEKQQQLISENNLVQQQLSTQLSLNQQYYEELQSLEEQFNKKLVSDTQAAVKDVIAEYWLVQRELERIRSLQDSTWITSITVQRNVDLWWGWWVPVAASWAVDSSITNSNNNVTIQIVAWDQDPQQIALAVQEILINNWALANNQWIQ